MNLKFEVRRFNGVDVISTSGEPIVPQITTYNVIEDLYNVSPSATNSKTIATNEEKTYTYTADNGYNLPESITVDGAEVADAWSKDDGTVTIKNPFKDVTITVIGDECFVAGTLITLADGTKKAIEEITDKDEILAWDFKQGKYVSTKLLTLTNHGVKEYAVTRLTFDDNTTIDVIENHGLFDKTLLRFINIGSDNANEYIGHEFVKCVDGNNKIVKLVSQQTSNKQANAYSIVTSFYLNALANDLLTIDPIAIALVPFKINEDLIYDKETYNNDINNIGLMTYEEFSKVIPYITETQFNAGCGENTKISIAKGYVTKEEYLEKAKCLLVDQKYLAK